MVLACASVSTVSPFPALALLIFGALCAVAVLMLVAVLQQEKCVLYLFLIPFVLYKDRNKSDNNDANAAEGGDVGRVRLYIRTYAFIL